MTRHPWMARSALALVAFFVMLNGAFAQDGGKIARVGLLSPGPPNVGLLGPALVDDFARLGYIDGKTITFERRAAQGKPERLPELVQELVASHVEVIITVSYPAAIAAKEHAGSTPIVVAQSGEPGAAGRQHHRRLGNRRRAFRQAPTAPEGGGAGDPLGRRAVECRRSRDD